MADNMKLKLLTKEIDNVFDNIVAFRKQIHMNPELGYKEFKTTESIIKILEENGVNVYTFSNFTGAVANIDNGCNKTIGLRVDIDALPMCENTGLEYSSKNNGIMHACGHDVHNSIGVGLAIILNRMRGILPVNVKIIFQPAEECSPNGGAKYLIEQGILKKPDVFTMLGFHVWPDYKVGEIAVKEGPIMAASDKFKITIKGEKSHAAQPHKGVDAIGIAIDVVNAIEYKLKREIDPFDPYIISIGGINSKGRYNVICDYVEIEGTMRTIDEKVRSMIHRRIREIVKGIALVYNGSCEIEIDRGYDCLINDKDMTQRFIKHANNVLGENNVNIDILSSLIGEDFSFFCKYVPTLYFHLGCDCDYPLHSDRFFAKEESMRVALELIGSFILNF